MSAAATPAISSGTAIVFWRATSTPAPELLAARKELNATVSSWIRISARTRRASARLCASAAPLQFGERTATFCSSAAAVATTEAAAEPLAGAGAPEAI
jgi:hypothetical protein